MPATDVRLPAHVVLREHTRDAHEATEAGDGMRRLMAGELDEGQYVALLAAQRELFAAWESANAHWIDRTAETTGWHYRSRAALLAEDLTVRATDALVGARPARDAVEAERPGSPATASQPAHENRPARSTPLHADEATFWGELYVIEGSALGGRVIVRRLRELYPRHAHRFYSVGEDAPSGWRRFQSILDTCLADDASRGFAVEGALRMFARFRQTLKEPARHV